VPAEQSNERVKRWKLPICTVCGGIVGFRLDGGCTCAPARRKWGKKIEVIPADSPNVLSVEEARFLGGLSGMSNKQATELEDRLARFAEEADRG
jgi:hypothetical protein